MSRREKPKLTLRRPPAVASIATDAKSIDAFVSGETSESKAPPPCSATIKRRRRPLSGRKRPAEKRLRKRADHRRMSVEIPSELAQELLAQCAASNTELDQALREAVTAWLEEDPAEHLPASRYEW